MGLIGFLDDFLKIIKKLKRGLIARYKLAGQITLGCVISYWIYQLPEFSTISTKTNVPFLKNVELDLGLLYPIMVIIVITGASNSVNLTDGLDGLAAGLLELFYSIFCYCIYFWPYGLFYIPKYPIFTWSESAILVCNGGACIGYLWFNRSSRSVYG